MSAPGSAGVPAGIRLKADEDVGAPGNTVPAGIRLKADEDGGAPRHTVPIPGNADVLVGQSKTGVSHEVAKPRSGGIGPAIYADARE